MAENNYIGNGTTIGKFIIIAFAGYVISFAAARGFDLGVDAQTLAEIIGAILGLIYAYIDAKYPNSFSWLGNVRNPVTVDAAEPVLNDEYETGVEDDDSA